MIAAVDSVLNEAEALNFAIDFALEESIIFAG
jgi:hypothetical protein